MDCAHCNEQIQEIRGCKKPLMSPKKIMIGADSFEFDRCPHLLTKGNIGFYLEAYGYYKNGYLPNAGTWMDQPLKLSQAFNVLASYIEKLNEVKDGKHRA